MTKGYVYILTNPSMPGLVKIGKTTRDPNGRATELDSTGVPTAFEVYCSERTPDCDALEDIMHRDFDSCRVRPNREFFRIDPIVVSSHLRGRHREQIEHWLADFIPDQEIVAADYYLDINTLHGSVHDALRDAKVCPPELVRVLECLRGEDIVSAIARWKVVLEQVQRDRAAFDIPLKVVGDE